MADLQHDYSTWAARKAGKGTQPEGAQPQGEQPAGESSTENQTDGEPPPPAHECVSQAVEEVTEAIDMLEKAKGQVDEPDDIQTIIDDLTAQQQALTEKAKELQETADENDGESTPGPESV